MNLTYALQSLGLSEKQARIYLALLQYGEGTAYEAAKQSGIKKSTTYVLLEEMVEQRVVKKVLHPKSTRYAALDPVDIFVDARGKLERAETALPELRALSKTENKRVNAEYYEGPSGVREMYQKLSSEEKTKEQVAFYAHGRDTSPELMNYWIELNKEYLKHGIKRRGITTNDPSIKDYLESKIVPKEFMQLKALSPKIYDSNISIEIFGSYTRILSHKYLQGIVINNPDIASVLKQIFEIVWKYAPTKE
jgi:HTH-type transcriptional regulator, sugar sensing transcriptional regulator